MRQTLGLFLVEILIALVSSWAMGQLGWGGISFLIGGVVAGLGVFWGCNRWTRIRPQSQPVLRKIGQGIVGLNIGYVITSSDPGALLAEFPIYCGLTLAAVGSGIGIALIYARTYAVRIMTALLATTPAGVGIMASVAADRGEDVSLVGMTQITRITTVVLAIPFLISQIYPDGFGTSSVVNQPAVDIPPLPSLGLLLMAIGLAGIGVGLAHRLKLPVAPMVGALLGGIGFGLGIQWIPWQVVQGFTIPRSFTALGQILLGLSIGEYWGSRPITQGRLWLGTLQVNGMTLIAGLGLAGVTHLYLGWDWLTSLLATSPGGASEMVLMALTFDPEHVGTVTATHLCRTLALNGLLPLWLHLFHHIEQLYPSPSE